jgi:hypothetical protein
LITIGERNNDLHPAFLRLSREHHGDQEANGETDEGNEPLALIGITR